MGEDLLRHSNTTEPSDLRQCPYDHKLTNKAYLSGVTVRNIYESFTHKMAAKTSWHRYGTKWRHCHPMYFYVHVARRLQFPHRQRRPPFASLLSITRHHANPHIEPLPLQSPTLCWMCRYPRRVLPQCRRVVGPRRFIGCLYNRDICV